MAIAPIRRRGGQFYLRKGVNNCVRLTHAIRFIEIDHDRRYQWCLPAALRNAKGAIDIMPTNLSAMLRSLLKARQTASSAELRFLREVARTLPTSSPSGRGAATMAAPVTAPRRTLKCPRCDRRFARPVHLGRHLSATHGRRKKAA